MKNLFFYSLLFLVAYGCVPEQPLCPQSQKCLVFTSYINGLPDTCGVEYAIDYRINNDTFQHTGQYYVNVADTFICTDFDNELAYFKQYINSFPCHTGWNETREVAITTPIENCFGLENCLIVETGTLDPSCDPLGYTVQFLVNGALNSYNGLIPSNTIDTILCVPWPNILQPVTGTGGITHECIHPTLIQSYTVGNIVP